MTRVYFGCFNASNFGNYTVNAVQPCTYILDYMSPMTMGEFLLGLDVFSELLLCFDAIASSKLDANVISFDGE